MRIGPRDWLIVVDYQNDFIPPDGALAVPGGDKLVGRINELLDKFPHALATRDWHPENHYSFRENGGRWPRHCVQNTSGAEFHPELNVQELDDRFKAGFKPEDRSDYNGFSGEDSDGKGMAEVLRDEGAEILFFAGLALEYCVKETAVAGLEEGFGVVLLEDCTEPVDEADGEKAIEEIKSKGGEVIDSSELG